ncbi:MAG: amidohydrolase [Acidobacteria bacterium]|nr:amidohydrolase [Acidobacteriota bacterium]
MRLPSLLLVSLLPVALHAADADLILHHGRVLTVDAKFTVTEAVAIKAGRVIAVGTSADLLRTQKGAKTQLIDLAGKTVLPGLNDAHVHILSAALSEYRRKLPPLDSVVAIQDYIRQRSAVTPKGEWIIVPRTLPPRLKEMRFPTREDLDVDTDHPVAFDGSYVWSANTLGLKISGITRDTPNPAGGEVVKGPDGEPNGILRNAAQLLKGAQKSDPFTEEEKLNAMEQMLRTYAAAGLTAVGDRAVTEEDVALLNKLKAQGRLPIRVAMTWRIDASRPVEQVEAEIKQRPWRTGQGDEWLKFSTFKVTLDGGQSVGTAYQRMPYGAFGRQLYGQTNPDARGTLFVEPEKLYRIFRTASDAGWQLTAHVQGGAAIDNLLDAFERLNKEKPIAQRRHHVMHGSFMSQDALDRMKRMGVAVDAQPGWMYFDVPALGRVFGLDKMRYFFPLASYLKMGIPVAGGSDHMIGWGKDTAVNAFNPFFNIWMSVARKTREGTDFYPEERVDRRDALKMWTTGAAWIQFSEKQRGSLEVGKLADLVVVEQDFLNCSEADLRAMAPVMTMVEGRVVYERK